VQKKHPIEATKEESGPCSYKINVVVSAKRCEEEFKNAYQAASRGIKIPGFRPGKAPASVLRQMLGDEAISHAKEYLIEQTSHDALGAVGLRNEVMRLHEIEQDSIEVNEGEEVKFEFYVDTLPQVTLPAYEDIKIEEESTEATDEQITEALQELGKSHQQFDTAENGQLDEELCALADLTYSLEEETSETTKDLRFYLGSPLYGAEAEEFDKKLKGCKGGETVEIEVEYKEGFQKPEWVGKKGTAKLAISEIQKPRPATPEEVAKTLNIENEEELTNRVSERIVIDNLQRENARQANEILKIAFEMNPFSLPQKMIEEEASSAAERHKQQMVQQGATEEQAQKEIDNQKDEALKSAEVRLQKWFVLRKFGEQEKIRVSKKDLDMAFRSIAAQQGLDLKMIKEFYKQQNMTDNLRSEIHESKTRSRIVEQVQKAKQKEAIESIKE
jgi:trigger factor